MKEKKPFNKAATKKDKKPSKYDTNLKINGSFDEAMKALIKPKKPLKSK